MSLESIKTVGCWWVLRPSRLLSLLAMVGVASLSAPTAHANPLCDPQTSCVYVVSTIDERQFAPLFVAIIIITVIQFVTLILNTTKPFDIYRRRRDRGLPR